MTSTLGQIVLSENDYASYVYPTSALFDSCNIYTSNIRTDHGSSITVRRTRFVSSSIFPLPAYQGPMPLLEVYDSVFIADPSTILGANYESIFSGSLDHLIMRRIYCNNTASLYVNSIIVDLQDIVMDGLWVSSLYAS
eukprot:TRINITY_DN5770_c0_g2_i1.p2 TRINITY_DN5770_c0_g2~~TRINITY_DN5770_c0_g2_i1.p2  ORF type:complete len:138 (+),score=27.81 TRINITY_DN5770_c0_g2_i1:488-901(+)